VSGVSSAFVLGALQLRDSDAASAAGPTTAMPTARARAMVVRRKAAKGVGSGVLEANGVFSRAMCAIRRRAGR
jgi:hypothetical protein